MANNFSIDDALFNLDASSLLKEDKKSTNSYDDLYRPSAKEGQGGIYKAHIRFIPYIKDPQQSIMSKWTVWLTNLNTDQSRMVDCPSTIKEKSILQEVFFALRKSDSASEVDLSSQFARRESFYSLVQIVKDPNHPELEGKIKIFKYGKKIYDKLKNIMNPSDDMSDTNNPFDLFTGRVFGLHIKTVSNFNNFDDCQFVSKESSIIIDGKEIKKTKEGVDTIKAYLEENSPDLGKYSYKPWDEDTKTFVLESIDSILPAGKLKSKLFKDSSESTASSNRVASTISRAKSSLRNEEVEESSSTGKVNLNIKRDELDDLLDDEDSTPKSTKKSKVPVIDDEDGDPYDGLD